MTRVPQVIPHGDFQEDGSYACPFMYNWIQCYVLFYVIAFHYGRPGMKFIVDHISLIGCNSASWAIAAVAASCLMGAAQAAYHYPNVVMEGLRSEGFQWWYVPLEFGVNTLQPLLLALGFAWLPLDLSWWGNTTLGTYSFHFYFYMYMKNQIPGWLTTLQPAGGLVQLLFVLSLPVLFMTFIGPFFHHLLLSPMHVYRFVLMCNQRRQRRLRAAQCS